MTFASGNVNGTAAVKNSMTIPKNKLLTELPYDPGIPLLLLYTQKKTGTWTDICHTQVLSSTIHNK